MPVFLLALLLAVLGWMWLERRRSGITRLCRWRQERAAGRWRCAACGAVQIGELAPNRCARRV